MFLLALFILGFLLPIAVKTQIANSKQQEENSPNTILIGIIEEMEQENGSLEDAIEGIMKQSDQLYQNGDYGIESLQAENQKLKAASGLTELAGRGVYITLKDSNKAKTGEYDQKSYIVHDKNLLYLVNDLRPVAEGISINGQRVIAMSDIRCVGTVILINQTRLAPPYYISVVGDQNKIIEALSDSTEYKAIVASPLEIEVDKKAGLTLPAYKGVYDFTYATIVEDTPEHTEKTETEE